MDTTAPLDPRPACDPAAEPSFEALHPNARWGFVLGTVAGWCLPLLPGLAILLAAWDGGGWTAPAKLLAFVLGALALALGAWRFGLARFARTRFALDAGSLRIRRGVIWQSETLVPRIRVQHTDVNRGPLDRHLGLSSLKVYTAGTKLASVTLDGLPEARALALRDALSNQREDDV
jgi:membrane protein YdbS with pleckstrin-like domain